MTIVNRLSAFGWNRLYYSHSRISDILLLLLLLLLLYSADERIFDEAKEHRRQNLKATILTKRKHAILLRLPI